MAHHQRPPDNPGAILLAVGELARAGRPGAAVLLLIDPSACSPTSAGEELWAIPPKEMGEERSAGAAGPGRSPFPAAGGSTSLVAETDCLSSQSVIADEGGPITKLRPPYGVTYYIDGGGAA